MKRGTTWTRRRFLDRLGRASAVVACAGASGAAASCAAARWAPHERVGASAVVAREAFDSRNGVLLDVAGLPAPIYLHRDDDGSFSAVLTRCTHRGCTAAPQGRRIVCPCHGSEYAPDGAVLRGPAERDLLRFPVHVDAEGIRIELGDEGGSR